MADLYENRPYIAQGGMANIQSQSITGDPDTDKMLESLSPEERQAAIEEINAPLTGEEVNELAKDANYNVTKEQFIQLRAYKKTEEINLLEGLSAGIDGILGDLNKAIGSVADHPLKATAQALPSLVEAFAQGTRNLYGMAAQSQNPDSPFFKMKEVLTGTGSDDEQYRQYQEARRFNKHSMALYEGKETLIMDKDVINHDMTQVMSYVADPTLFIPFGAVATGAGKALGMGEGLAKAMARASAIKNAAFGNALKWGVGAPLEIIGGATRNTIDYAATHATNALETASGLEARELAGTLRASGLASVAAGVAGHSIPYATPIATAHFAGGAMAGFGQAFSVLGEQIKAGERGINSFARQALIDTQKQGINLSRQAKGLLTILDSVDPFLSYANTMAGGAASGALIGGGLGYLSDKGQGFAAGAGAGIALGGIGAGAGRMFADVKGGIVSQRASVQAEMVLQVMKEKNPDKYKALSLIREVMTATGEADQANMFIAGLDNIAPNTDFVIKTNADYVNFIKEQGLNPDNYKGGHTLPNGEKLLAASQWKNVDGMTVTNNTKGKVTVYINADNLAIQTKGARKVTLPHEIFHAVFRDAVGRPEFKDRLMEHIYGVRDPSGKLVKQAAVQPKEVLEMFRKYTELLHPDDAAARADSFNIIKEAMEAYQKDGTLIRNDKLSERPVLDHYAEEFGAYYFSHWVTGKAPDYLFKGGKYTGIEGMFKNIKKGWLDFFASRMGEANPEFDFFRKQDSINLDQLFHDKDGKRVVNKSLELFMEDFVKQTADFNSKGGFSLDSLSPEGQRQYIESQGLDGVYVPVAKRYRATRVDSAERHFHAIGKEMHKALEGLDPKLRTTTKDANGDIVGTFSEAELDHLVGRGHISRELANKISLFQKVVANQNNGNIAEFTYHGRTAQTQEVQVDPRLTGKAVPITYRSAVVFAIDNKVGKNGGFHSFVTTLDYKAMETRAKNLWSDANTQAKWNHNYAEFISDFGRYMSNAVLPLTDPNRVPSAGLWAVDGAAKRDIMHQMAGIPNEAGVPFVNQPLARIPDGVTQVLSRFSLNRMSNVRLTDKAIPFNDQQARHDLARNFKPANMDVEETAKGKILTHASGFKLMQVVGNKYRAFDEAGNHIGTYDSAELAGEASRRVFQKAQDNIPEVARRVQEQQDKIVRQNKPLNQDTREEAIRLGDMFKTQEVRDFTQGTLLHRQTRQEYVEQKIVDSIKDLSYHNIVQNLYEQVRPLIEQGEQLQKQINVLVNKKLDLERAERNYFQETKSYSEDLFSQLKNIEKQIENTHKTLETISDKIDSFNGYELQETVKAINLFKEDGDKNTLVNNMPLYALREKILKTHFTKIFNESIQTGQPITIVGTHGTQSFNLMISKMFSASELGKVTDCDSSRMGHFFSGSQETSGGSYAGRAFSAKTEREILRHIDSLDVTREKFFDKLNELLYDSLNQNDLDNATKIVYKEHQALLKQFDIANGIGMSVEFKENKETGNYKVHFYSIEGNESLLTLNEVDKTTANLIEKEFTKAELKAKNDYELFYNDNHQFLRPEQWNKMQLRALLRMDNPYVYDYKNASYREESFAKLIAQAQAAGHDGVVFKNVRDGGPHDNIYVVLKGKEETNIKVFDSTFDEVQLPRGEGVKNGKEQGLQFKPKNRDEFVAQRSDEILKNKELLLKAYISDYAIERDRKYETELYGKQDYEKLFDALVSARISSKDGISWNEAKDIITPLLNKGLKPQLFDAFVSQLNSDSRSLIDSFSDTESYSSKTRNSRLAENFAEREFNKQQAIQPAFKSALKENLDAIFAKRDSITPAELLGILRSKSQQGVRLTAEADAMGLTEFLAGKTGKVSKEDVLKFYDENKIELTLDRDAKADVGDTSTYVNKSEPYESYHEFAVRINEPYSSRRTISEEADTYSYGGHYGKGELLHIRGTIRVAKDGTRYFHIEEMQTTSKKQSGNLKEIDSLKTEIELYQHEVKNYEEEIGKASESINQLEGLSENEANSIIKRFKELSSFKIDLMKWEAHDSPKWNEWNKVLSKEYKKLLDEHSFLNYLTYGHSYNEKLSNRSSVLNYLENTRDEFTSMLAESQSLLKDRQTSLNDVEADAKKNPLTVTDEWIATAVKSIIRRAVELGVDKVSITSASDLHEALHFGSSKEFYDSIVPQKINKFLKKYGVQLETSVGKANDEFVRTYKAKQSSAYSTIEKARNVLSTNTTTMDAVLDALKQTVTTKEKKDTVKLIKTYLDDKMRKVYDSFEDVLEYDSVKRVDSVLGAARDDLNFDYRKVISLLDKLSPELEASSNKKGAFKNAVEETVKKLHNATLASLDAHAELARIKFNLNKPELAGVDNLILAERSGSFPITEQMANDAVAGYNIYKPKNAGEGGKTYDQSSREWKFGFLGRVAQENPELSKDKNIQFSVKEGKADGTKFARLSIDAQSGKVGGLNAVILPDGETARISGAFVSSPFRNKGLGNLVYSEMAERLRSMGIKKVTGEVVDERGRPVAIRDNVLGDTRLSSTGERVTQEQAQAMLGSESAKRRRAEGGYAKIDVENELNPNIQYAPSAKTPKRKDFDKLTPAQKKKAYAKWLAENTAPANPERKKFLERERKRAEASFKAGDKYKEQLAAKEAARVAKEDKEAEKQFKIADANRRIIERHEAAKREDALMADAEESARIYEEHDKAAKEAADAEQERLFGEGVESADYWAGKDAEAAAARQAAATPEPSPALPNKNAVDRIHIWRSFKQEVTGPKTGILRNGIGYTIHMLNNKFRVYNPQMALLGVYNDLEQAKRRIQREEPKS